MSDQSADSEDRQLPAIDRLQWGKLRDWVQLIRLPTSFTLISNVIAAAVVATGNLQPLTAFVPILIASLLAYWAGMILNDVVDLDEDKKHRPGRPLPAGRISPVIAGHVATAFLFLTPIIVLGVMSFHQVEALWLGASFVSAALLSCCVRLYDSSLKATPLGPVLMGSCRAFNICMVGASFIAVSGEDLAWQHPAAYALGIGVYILGLTIYASSEELSESSKGLLGMGLIVEMAGLAILAAIPMWLPSEERNWALNPAGGYPLLIGLIGITVVRQGLTGIQQPVPRRVQLAVRHAILSIILVDAGVATMWGTYWHGLAVALLLVPALVSSLRVRAT